MSMTINSKQLLTEAFDYIENEFSIKDTQVSAALGEDKDVHEAFVEKLSEGLTEVERADFVQAATNSRETSMKIHLLEGNSSSGMGTFAVLDTMMLREIWNRTGAREAMTYKVLQKPQITIPFLKQYMVSPNGEYIDVPTALKEDSLQGKILKVEIDIDSENTVNVFKKNSITDHSQLTLHNWGEIYQLECQTPASIPSHTGAQSQTVSDVKVSIKCETTGTFKHDVTFSYQDSGDTLYFTDTLVGYVDRETGDVAVMSTKGLIKKALYKVKVSTESNKMVYEFDHKFENVDIQVGDGDTINSKVPVQYIQDLKALFDLDAISMLSKDINKAISQIYDKEVYNTFANSIEDASQTLSFDASMIYGGAHIGISRQMQNGGLLERVYKGIACIDNRYQFSQAETDYYVICNSIENVILSGGITPDYSGTPFAGGTIKHYTRSGIIGNVNNNDIRVISSGNYKPGKMYIVPKPSVESEIVFGYFDYSQVMMPLGTYRTQSNPLVPSIFMNKRKVIHSFRPLAVQCIDVKNNTAE